MTGAFARRALSAWLIGLWVALFVCASSVGAQSAVAASAPESVNFPDSHAWVVMKDHPGRPGRGRAVLVHIAPRTGELAAPVGSAQLARTLDQFPLVMAAAGERVYLAFNGVDDNRRAVVRVRSVRAARQGFGWAFEPSDRFTPHPALQHSGGVASMAAAEDLIAMVVTTTDGDFEVFVLVRNDWVPVALPPVGPDARVEAWSTPRGVMVGIVEGQVLTAYDLRLEAGAVVLGEPQGLGTVPTSAALLAAGGTVFAIERTADALSIARVGTGGPIPVASVDLPEGAVFAPVSARGPRLLALWWEEPHRDDGAPSMPNLHTLEVSLGSGAVLYEGPLPTSKFISADEFRVLAMLLFAVFVGVLLIVLKSDPEGAAVPLPEGFALAEPSRRVVASGLDFAAAAWIVSLSYGVGFWDLVSLKLLFTSDSAWTAIPATFVVGALIGTLSEWFSGRTFGKVLTGIRVIRVGTKVPESPRVALRKSLIRNTIKWFLPPVAALAAVDNQGRHRGDKAAGLVVVKAVEPQGPET